MMVETENEPTYEASDFDDVARIIRQCRERRTGYYGTIPTDFR